MNFGVETVQMTNEFAMELEIFMIEKRAAKKPSRLEWSCLPIENRIGGSNAMKITCRLMSRV
jgi:hypothetical protein